MKQKAGKDVSFYSMGAAYGKKWCETFKANWYNKLPDNEKYKVLPNFEELILGIFGWYNTQLHN